MRKSPTEDAPLTLGRRERLRGRDEIRLAFRRCQRQACQGLELLYRANGLEYNRVLVSTRRGFGGAVERNKGRRRVREAVRQLKPRVEQGYDLVLLVAPGHHGYEERKDQVLSLLARAGLLRRD